MILPTFGAAINILRKVWTQIALLQEKTCVRKIGAALGRAYVCAVWQLIFKIILNHITKQDLGHSGYERDMIKETKGLTVIVCIGVSTPPQKHHPLFSCQAPSLNWQTVQAPFLGNPPLYIGFLWTPPPWKSDFSVNPQNIFFIFNTIISFKSN